MKKVLAVLAVLLVLGSLALTSCAQPTDPKVTALQNQFNTLQTQYNTLQTAVNSLPTTGTVTNTITTSLTTLNTKITALDSSVADLKNQVASGSSNSTSTVNAINALQSKINDLTTQLTTVNKSITDLQTAETADATAIKAMKTSNAATSTGTTTGASGSTNGVLTVSIANPFAFSNVPYLLNLPIPPVGGYIQAVAVTSNGAGYTSPPAVTFNGGTAGVPATAVATVAGGIVTSIQVTSGGSGYTMIPTVTLTGGGATTPATAYATAQLLNTTNVSQSFQIQIANSSASPCNNVQLVLGLVATDGSGNMAPSIPTWINPATTIIVSGLNFMQWTYQQTVTPNTFIYANGNVNNVLNFGTLSVPTGTTSLTVTVQVNNTGDTANVTTPFYLYPIIKVGTYTQ